MTTEEKNLEPKDVPHETIEDSCQQLAKNFDFGKGVTMVHKTHASIEDAQNDKNGIVRQVFSTKLPKLHSQSKNMSRDIEIGVYSAESDDQQLLHHLYSKNS
jgi:hypothetical protein